MLVIAELGVEVIHIPGGCTGLCHLSRTQKSSNQSLLYQEMSTRSGSNIVLREPINFYCYTHNSIYESMLSIMYKTFLNHNLLYQVMSTRSVSI